MSRQKKIGRNIGIILFCMILMILIFDVHVSPYEAMRASEKSMKYGPAFIVEEVKTPSGVAYLGKYDKWYSVIPVIREFGWTYGFGSLSIQEIGNKKLEYSYMYTTVHKKGELYIFGLCEDKDIVSVRVLTKQGKIFEIPIVNEGFLHIEPMEKTDTDYYIESVYGIDENGKVIYDAINE